MKISVSSIIEKLIWLLAVFLFASFLIFDTYSWGRYAFFGVSILIVLLNAINYNGILRWRLQPFHIFALLFAGYVALSSLWAMQPSDPITKSKTILQVLLCASMLYLHYDRTNNTRPLCLAVMWSGYVVVVYAILFYGLDTMLASSQDIRLENEFSNVNNIAMAAAISCMLQWNEVIHKRNIWSAVMIIPSVILIGATQSRKAFILLLAGVVLVYVMKTMGQKGFFKKVLSLLFYLVLLLVAMRVVLSLPIFSGSLERMGRMLNFWSEEGTADHSTIMRNDMMELGMEWFKKNPIGGIGMGNPHILSARYLNFDAYLHNNFVELLCGGGIVGFAVYYSMHVYLLFNLIKYRKADHETFSIAMVWLLLTLIMHYGMVTYYSKLQWYYLVVHFLNVSQLKRKHKEMIDNAKKPAPQGD
ncbi:MAG: O-antigen ligase family protein [Oscillospiraceae bacterium]|nr:O-antigen ligase family protein [Oscillospiraceae bacterium]